MCRMNHGVAVDYFAVGVIGYECMLGTVKINLKVIEAISWKIKKRNQRLNFSQISDY
jgi:hypothetical protein